MLTLPSALTMRSCCSNCGATEFSSFNLRVPSHFSSRKKAALGFSRVDVAKRFLEVDWSMVVNSGWNVSSRTLAGPRASVQKNELAVDRSSGANGGEKVSTFRFRTENGGFVKVSVRKKTVKYAVCVEVLSMELDANYGSLMLSWGIYRSDSSCFMPPDSQHLSPDSGTIDSPFVQISIDMFVLELEFEAKQTPFYLSFLLKSMSSSETKGLEIRSHRKANFCIPIGFDPGHPAPLGLSYSNDGSMNFAFFSKDAEGVILCLYDDTTTEKPAMELDLDPYVNRSGDIWHALLEGAWNFVIYGYRCKKSVSRDDSSRILLDPYAKVTTSLSKDLISPSLPKFLARLCKEPSFDWSGDVRPNLAMEELVVYRLNVKRFTEDKSSQLYSDIVGTFTGVTEKVNHFKDLGINSILLEPIFPFDEQKGPYYPCQFYSPANLYGPYGGSISAITSMKEMVKTLHANGIEVFLEVVFTYTAEHGALQGIDDSSYYYTNKAGDLEARNALNCNNPIVQSLLLNSLRHWVTEFHVDGFSFVNSSDLLRGFYGESLSRPPLVEAVAFDPLLSKTKIIADCWDPQDVVAKETSFPHWKRWAEVNSKFCYDIRNFLRGEGLLSDLATRLCGSGDIFSSGRGPAFSFNFVSSNFGLPLVDLVSFSGGELASECSWNCGEEGPTNKTLVLERRLKQVRNFLFVLYISLGVPVLNMGDECGQSTGGSKSYGDRKPFNWNALSTSFGVQTTEFISFLSLLRKRRRDILQNSHFLKEENISWHGSNQSPPRWEDPSCKFLAMTLKADESSESNCNGNLFIAFNAAGLSERVILPPVPEGTSWQRLVDTALPFPGFFSDDGKPVVKQKSGVVAYEMKSHSCTLFEARAR